MKKTTRARKSRSLHTYTEAQLAGLRASASARRLATVERLQSAIASLKAKKQAITVQTVYEECGLRYAAVHRNPEALALFRASSTHLTVSRKRNKRKQRAGEETTPSPRDPLLSYKKPELVMRLRLAQQQLLDVQQQQAVLVEASLKREAKIAELEGKLAVLEPYRTFVMQMRAQMQREENGPFNDLPPSL